MEVKQNPKTIECLKKINNYKPILAKLSIPKIYNPGEIKFQEDVKGFYYYKPNIKPNTYIAAFDMDWTLTYATKHLFPKEPDDVYIIPGRFDFLENLIKQGYTLALFTNQKVKSKAEETKRVERVTTFIKKLGLPIFAFIATKDDVYRKPNTGMWDKLKEFIPDIKYAFYCGDALGRPQDFSDSDKVFAENIDIPYYAPENLFPTIQPKQILKQINTKKSLVVFVGMPGSGKTSYYNDNFKSTHNHANQDTLGTLPKVLKSIEQSMKEGQNVVVDSTNSKLETRQKYFDLANKYNYNVSVIFFIRDGTGWNKLRSKPVPMIAYHTYFKYLEVPTIDNTPGNVFEVV